MLPLVLAPDLAGAEPDALVVTGEPFHVDDLGGRARLLVDTTGAMSLDDARAAGDRWSTASGRGAFDRGYMHGAAWLTWSVHNLDDRPRLLRFLVGTPQIDRADMHVVRDGGRVETQHAGDALDVPQTTPSWRPSLDLELRPGERVEIFVRVETTSAMSVSVVGMDLSSYPLQSRTGHRYSGLMLGLLLGLLVYHLAAFVSGREQLHLWYTVQTGALMLYGASVDGTAGMLLTGYPDVVSKLPVVAVAVLGLSINQFLRHFLHLEVQGGWRDRGFVGLGLLSAATLPLILLAPARVGVPMATSINLLGIFAGLLIATSEARRQPAAVRVVLIGWSAVVVIGLYAGTGALGVGGELQAGRDMMRLAFLFERVTMALPLASRIRQLHERADASTAEAQQARQRTARESRQRLDVETKLQAREAELRQSQKMEVVGQLAGGLAHDFNNTLQVVLSMSDLLRREGISSAERQEMLDSLANTAEQSAAITRRLLLLSRIDAKAPTAIDANEMIRTLLKVLKRIMGSQIVTKLEAADGPCVVRADAMQLEQAITNLVINARDAMPDGGTLTMRVRRVGSAALPQDLGAMAETEYAEIEVADTGYGIESEARARMFEPFFTTKPAGSGTGLGLAMVRGMLDAHDGLIDVESSPGQGARFRLYLPLADAAELVEAPAPEPLGTGTERLLVVEDHPKVRVYFQRVLRDAGYDVRTARDGRDALAMFEEYADGPPDLIVSDLVMPGLTGWQLLEEVRARRPEQLFLFCSGYSEEFVHERVHLDAGTRLLSKPCTGAALLAEVRAALQAPHSEAHPPASADDVA